MSLGRTIAALAVVAALGSACSNLDEVSEYRELGEEVEDSNRVWQVVPAEVDEVARVVVSDGVDSVEVRRSSGFWTPGQGADDVSAALMFEAEDIFAPMLAYRQLEVDATSPEFGLVDSNLVVTVETATGASWQVRLGGPTPSGYGYYALRSDDPYVYTVIPQVVDDANGLLIGEKIVRPPDPRLVEALEELANPERLEEEVNPWLAQVLDYEE